MKRWTSFVALGLLSVSLAVLADDKDKKGKKDKDAPTPAQVIQGAEAKVTAGDLDGAIEDLKKLGPENGDALLALGRIHSQRYELDVAIDELKAASEKLTGAPKGEALGRMATLEDMRGVATAGATAEAAVAADPAGAWPAIALSRARARQGKGDEAVELAKKAEAAGGGAAAATALGAAQEARGDAAAAEAAYRAALGTDAGAVAPAVGLARIMRKTGRASEAEPLLQKAIASAPGAIDAYKESARVKLALDRAEEAFGDASTAAAMAENDPDAQKLVGEVTVAKALAGVRTGQVDLAIQDLTALRDKDPNQAAVRVGLAKAYVAKRQPDAAIAELQKAVEIEPGNADAQYQLGYVQHVMKQNAAAAVPAYEKAVAAEPANVTYRTNLGAALTETKQPDRAVAELTKVVETPGYNKADAWIYLGQAQLAAKRFKDALPALEKAAAISPDNPAVEAYLGWTYFGLKDSANFKLHAGKAKALGHKEPTLLAYLTRVEAGEAIK